MSVSSLRNRISLYNLEAPSCRIKLLKHIPPLLSACFDTVGDMIIVLPVALDTRAEVLKPILLWYDMYTDSHFYIKFLTSVKLILHIFCLEPLDLSASLQLFNLSSTPFYIMSINTISSTKNTLWHLSLEVSC